MGKGEMLLNVFHTECLKPFIMKGKSEKQQSPKLNWILVFDQSEIFVNHHQRIRLELDLTIWVKLCR